MLKELGVCFKCCASTNHLARNCKADIKCEECGSDKHATALHTFYSKTSGTKASDPEAEHGGEQGETIALTSSITTKCTEICGEGFKGRSCSKICLVRIYPKGHPVRAVRMYAIMDDQSNRSLARSEFFDQLSVGGNSFPYTLRTCSGLMETAGRRASGLMVEAIDSTMKLALPTVTECNEIPDDRSEIPTPEVARHHPHLEPIAKFIPPLDHAAQILLLLGRDMLRVHKVRDQRNGPHDAPYAQRLDLGWVIVGDVCLDGTHKSDRISTFRTSVLTNGRTSLFKPCPNHFTLKEKFDDRSQGCTIQADEETSMLKENVGHTVFVTTKDDDKSAPSLEDKEFFKIMDREFFQDESNSWVAPLPFRNPRCRLPNNREQALSRLNSLRRTLDKKPEMKNNFASFMKNIFDSGHAEAAPLEEGQECWYLPIFGVYHPKKPDQIRVVFDSSAQFKGIFLNNVMLTGPDLNNSLLGLLIRFRKESIAVTADIQQMFHCFIVREDDRNYLRFLWYHNNNVDDRFVEYRIKVHVFGNSPSPAVATYGLRRTVQAGEGEFGKDAKRFVERDFYVDDALKSMPTASKAIDLLQRTQGMLATANLRLHKIASSSVEVIKAFPSDDRSKDLKDLDLNVDTPPIQRSLGLSWDLKADTFTFRVSIGEKPYTRRGILSMVNSLYDSLGFVAPVTIQGRWILRDLCADTQDWDSPLPEERRQEWETWRNSLRALEQLQIPRSYTPTSLSVTQRKKLHVFADASMMPVAAVAYLKTTSTEGIQHVEFILGKAKLAPQPDHTIPRLELCGAVLATEVAELILDEFDVKLDAVKFYMESKVVLGYINNQTRRFYTYISNRVGRIRRSTQPEQWNYVPTDRNPADFATRSVPAFLLNQTIWLTGPAFLLRCDGSPCTTKETFGLIEPESDKEIRPHVTTFVTNVRPRSPLSPHHFEHFSKWTTLVRAIAHLTHIADCFHRPMRGTTGSCNGWHHCTVPRTEDELSRARKSIFCCVQQAAYASEINPSTRKRTFLGSAPSGS
ncbi:uncharacterized protein LOC133358195 isoform X1 [Lethenteron reissneri]|uniref:uncharacterized protein LOC133358195 isoform X1 n=1 Tax=Lethenteron reissneri TaxID=7753 RepID=UPI002AB62EB4|nr:uncharacterized protein LOC133358195 isoform X1 [Lethenteron reissneri]XP_061432403.1 uncharacterized protein LOC133358195 isoform X1 [Lethenteron reissneri]